MTDNCPKCGKNLALVGRMHNCVPNTSPNANITSPNEIQPPAPRVERHRPAPPERSGVHPTESAGLAAPSRNARWRAKNPEAYRAYMKSYMAKRRKGSQ